MMERLKPLAPTAMFFSPKGMPPPVTTGDPLPGNKEVGLLADRIPLRGRTIWRFYVQEKREPVALRLLEA